MRLLPLLIIPMLSWSQTNIQTIPATDLSDPNSQQAVQQIIDNQLSTLGGTVSGNIYIMNPDGGASGRLGIATTNPSALFQVGTATMVATSAGNVGVGTSNPAVLFQVGVATFAVTASGNVGIGTTAPAYALDVTGAVVANNASQVIMSFTGTTGVLGTLNNTVLSIRTNNVNRLYIDTSGLIGINTTAPISGYRTTIVDPSNAFIVVATGTADNGQQVGALSNSLVSNDFSIYSVQGRPLVIGTNGTRAIFINASQQVGVGTNSPGSVLDVSSGGNTVLTMGAWSAWTPTFTGFSTDPTGWTARYIRIGKTIIATFISGTSGTSNATTFTITLPVAANTANIGYPILVQNNGAVSSAPGRMDLTAASTTGTIYNDMGALAFTASGNKSCWFTISYEGQ